MTSSSKERPQKYKRFGPEWRKARAETRRISRKVRRGRRKPTGREYRAMIRFSMYLDAWVDDGGSP